VVREQRELAERALVEQQVESLADGQLPVGVLAFDALRPAHLAELGALLGELFGVPAQVRALVRVGGGAGLGGLGGVVGVVRRTRHGVGVAHGR
jgi:hypothetical protein